MNQLTHTLGEVQKIKDELDKVIFKDGKLPLSGNAEKEAWAQDVADLLGDPYTRGNKLFDKLFSLHEKFTDLFVPIWTVWKRGDADDENSEWGGKVREMFEDGWSINYLLSSLREFSESLKEKEWDLLDGNLNKGYKDFKLLALSGGSRTRRSWSGPQNQE